MSVKEPSYRRVELRFDPADYELIATCAKRLSIPIATWIRSSAVQDARKVAERGWIDAAQPVDEKPKKRSGYVKLTESEKEYRKAERDGSITQTSHKILSAKKPAISEQDRLYLQMLDRISDEEWLAATDEQRQEWRDEADCY